MNVLEHEKGLLKYMKILHTAELLSAIHVIESYIGSGFPLRNLVVDVHHN